MYDFRRKSRIYKECKGKNYLAISPRMIRDHATLVGDYKTMELYENMDENTKTFAEEVIVNLISNANYHDREAETDFNLYLVFCGDFADLPDNIGKPSEFADFIKESKERIVAVYRWGEAVGEKNFFDKFTPSETIYEYHYLYLSMVQLLDEFEKNNVKFEIDTTWDRSTRALYRDDAVTNFVIRYSPKKEIEGEKGPKLQKELK